MSIVQILRQQQLDFVVPGNHSAFIVAYITYVFQCELSIPGPSLYSKVCPPIFSPPSHNSRATGLNKMEMASLGPTEQGQGSKFAASDLALARRHDL
jgi:hypothetical protein